MADNLLDKASILLTPTAYDNGSMLSVKPENGDGDFTFSRSSAATRVNAQGLVENVQIISSELVSNGNFSQIGTEEVSNGNFSQEGSEQVTNGDFATNSDWDLGSSWTISGGKANYDATSNGSELRQLMSSIAVGKTIKIQFDISDVAATKDAFFKLDCSGAPESIFGYTKFSQGTYTYYHTITSGFDRLTFTPLNSSTGGAFSIDNVSVKEVGQNWSLGSGWSVGDDEAIATSSANGMRLSQYALTPVVGKTYKVTYEIKSITQGAFRVWLGGFLTPNDNTAIGVYTFYITATDTSYFYLRAVGVTSGSITNISVKEVGQDWTFGTGWSIDQANSKAVSDGTTSNLQQFSVDTSVVGKKYKISLYVSDYLSGFLSLGVGGYDYVSPTITGNGEHTRILEVTNSSSNDRLYIGSSSFSGSITNISVKEITDDTNIPRINYEGFSYQDTLGSEEVVNGDFSSDSNWNKGTSWSITEGKAVCNGGGSYLQQQPIVFEVGKTYKCKFDIIDYTSGTVRFRLSTSNNGSELSGKGSYTEYITIVSKTDNYLNIIGSSFIGSIDNVSVKEVTGQEVVPDSGCGSWLLEPQSTNLITYSEDFSQSSWTKENSSVVSGFVSPDGTNNAYKLVNDSSNGLHSLRGSSISSTVSDHSLSLFVKAEEVNKIGVRDTVTGLYLTYNISADIVIESNVASYNISKLTNGWNRVSIVFQGSGSAIIQPKFYLLDDSYVSGNPQAYSYTGNGTDGLYIYGSQAEQQPYATSYIPTNGATSTRLQDIATNSGNSTLINSTEGVLYAEISALADGTNQRWISIGSGSNANRVSIHFNATNRINCSVRGSSTAIYDANHNIGSQTNNSKVAIRYKDSDFAFFVNGVKVNSQTSGTLNFNAALDTLSFDSADGGSKFFGNTKGLKYYPKALADVQLEDLTS